MSDPLQDLLAWVANESDYFIAAGSPSSVKNAEADARFEKLKKAWLNAGCPGLALGPKRPAPPTTHVRIAVVQRGIEWAAVGWPIGLNWQGTRDGTLINAAYTRLEGAPAGPTRVDFVEADIPAPPMPETWLGTVRKRSRSNCADCTCYHTCADDPETACSLSGDFHVHAGEPCPVHPGAPGDE